MTPQEAFNKAYVGVIEQGGPSVSSDGRCLYRATNGRKCGVGHLFDDDALAEAWDHHNLGIHAAVGDEKAPKWMREATMSQLLQEIQRSHDLASDDFRDQITGEVDDEAFLEKFKEHMVDVSKHFGLAIPQLEN